MISIIVPTFNEAENIEVLVEKLDQVLGSKKWDWEIVVVDDQSPDGTASRARSLSERFPVLVCERTGKRGLAISVIEGIEQSRGEVCVIMDADLSHPCESIPEMVQPIIDQHCDAAVGSRYVSGGGCQDWPLIRQVCSRGAGFLAKGLTRLSDPTSGFMAFRKSILQGVELDPVGWKIVLEIISKTRANFIEVPIVFADRSRGESKLGLTAHRDYLCHLWRLYRWRMKVGK